MPVRDPKIIDAKMKWIIRSIVFFIALNGVVAQPVVYLNDRQVINNQSMLDRLLNDSSTPKENRPSNITIEMTANDYTLDIPKFIRAVNVVDGDIFTILGTGGIINITCANNEGLSDNLRSALFSRAASIVFDGVMFRKCPAPLRFENVAMVMIVNCVFQ